MQKEMFQQEKHGLEEENRNISQQVSDLRTKYDAAQAMNDKTMHQFMTMSVAWKEQQTTMTKIFEEGMQQ